MRRPALWPSTACRHEMEIPQPGYAEHDAEQTWWGELCTISKTLIRASGVDPKDIDGARLQRHRPLLPAGR